MDNKIKNPCGLDGFAFLEFSAPDQAIFDRIFTMLGYKSISKHKTRDITCYKQGNSLFLVNAEPNCQAAEHAKTHGSGACAMGFNTKNAHHAYEEAVRRGAIPFKEKTTWTHELPAIEGIGGSVIYFVDDSHQPFGNHWQSSILHESHQGSGLLDIDHLTHNVHRGEMDKWATFYEKLFNFKQIRYFDIEGEKTGLVSRALGSPCGKIKIPLNESKDDKSQIEEFLHDYGGEGIQHIALSTHDIYKTIEQMNHDGVKFLDTPTTYYEMIHDRISWHTEPLDRLKKDRILIDGGITPNEGLLLQIFTENLFGPVFFEIIQRKGNEGFGEGNFQALFEAIERDQMRRGTL